jgi:hypothetical protein
MLDQDVPRGFNPPACDHVSDGNQEAIGGNAVTA